MLRLPEFSPIKTRSGSKLGRAAESPEIADLTEERTVHEENVVNEGLREPGGSTSTILPVKPPRSRSGLTANNHAILLRKQRWLREYSPYFPLGSQNVGAAVDATLVFAQAEAGTAVCISPDGLLLTCSHCVAESVDGVDVSKSYWLLFASSRIVEANCVAWDGRRDLALLKVVAAQEPPDLDAANLARPDQNSPFQIVSVSETAPKLNSSLACVGQPGADDLETERAEVKTHYDILHVSAGKFRGYETSPDLQDNSEIGALKHDCWTYWGHSGAPLIEQATGKLIGLHSSWDDETGMRRGIALEAILEFLKEHDVVTR